MALELFLATRNAHKREEVQRILSPFGITISEVFPLNEVEEIGTTFAENAFRKAKYSGFDATKPCISDDSGLCVDALDGAPGRYSARYAGKRRSDAANLRLLCQKLSQVPEHKRTAHYICAVCCVLPDGNVWNFEARCEGRIILEPRGSSGFGYDPVFVPREFPKKTMAELSSEEKDGISHRGIALRLLANELQQSI